MESRLDVCYSFQLTHTHTLVAKCLLLPGVGEEGVTRGYGTH